MSAQAKFNQNPLAGLMRQPKIYIKLPSNGEFWSEGSLDMPVTNELPVYSMTAKDELMLKIPDAVINGQAVVDVIQHCMPNIKNAWSIPNIDIDVILIAIRIATYGEKMTVPVSVKGVDASYELDLRLLMAQLQNQIAWNPVVPISQDLTIYVRPIDYKIMADSAVQTFETQRVLQIASSDSMSEEDKIKLFKESFNKLNDLTVGIINKSVYKIEASQGATEIPAFINEFMDNVDKDVFDKIKLHVESLRENNSVKPLKIAPTEEMIAAGVTDTEIEVPLVFDPSTFFA